MLPGRENIILTRDTEYKVEGCTVINSVDKIKEFEKNRNEELFVIGGAEVFQGDL